MKRYVHVFTTRFRNQYDQEDTFSRFGFDSIKTHPLASLSQVGFKLSRSDGDAVGLLLYLRDRDPKIFLREENVYTARDLDAAELLDLSVDMAEREIVPKNRSDGWGTDGACETCLAGARPVSAISVDRERFPKKGLIASDLRLLLVHERIAAALEKVMGDSLDLQPTRHSLDREYLQWHVVSPRLTMPPLHDSTRGVIREKVERRCRACDRSAYYHTTDEAFEPVFKFRDVFSPLPFIASSWECFGLGTNRPGLLFPPRPLLIVSQRIRQVFVSLEVRGLRWTPVAIR